MKEIESSVYTAKEVAQMLKRCTSYAYSTIGKMNREYAKKRKIPVGTLSNGRISKELFHEYYPEIKNS